MDDFTRINQPRVDKIMGFLDTIDKSAKSQRVDNATHDHLLDPLRRRLGAIEPTPQVVPAAAPNLVHQSDLEAINATMLKRTYAAPQNAPRWADMRDMIENATYQECCDALVWISTKLTEQY